ncbi:hypothetical protein [Streptomyces flavofungini]|nr:hypothetical protein [Streptomyces flavofungini]
MSTIVAFGVCGALVISGCGAGDSEGRSPNGSPNGSSNGSGNSSGGTFGDDGGSSSHGSGDSGSGGSPDGGSSGTSSGSGEPGSAASGGSRKGDGSGDSGSSTWDGGGSGGSTWKPGDGSGGRSPKPRPEPEPEKEFSWTPPGPDSPAFDAMNTNHIYDLVHNRNCQRARDWYETAGPGRRQQNPAGWKLISGLIGACFAVGGQQSEWRTVTEAYDAIRNQPSGDCKYVAGRRTLGQLAEFRAAHPKGKIRIRPAPASVQACPPGITEMRPKTVVPGDTVWVRGTWPSEVTAHLDGREVPLVPDANWPSCCHNTTVKFDVPADMPEGTVRVTLRARSITLDAGPLELSRF